MQSPGARELRISWVQSQLTSRMLQSLHNEEAVLDVATPKRTRLCNSGDCALGRPTFGQPFCGVGIVSALVLRCVRLSAASGAV